MKFSAVRRRRIHEDVADQIEDQILSGALAEGDSLPSERELMEAFNVGRPAVREALLVLQHNGMIEVSSSGRPVVTRPRPENVLAQLSGSARYLLSSREGDRSFQDARRLFEAAIARNAAELATPEDIEKLQAALDANRRALGDLREFERTDVAFHLAIACIGSNPVFTAIHTAISGWLSLQRTVSLRVEGVAESALESHEDIFSAIAAGNPERAWLAMDNHLKDIIRVYAVGRRDAGD